jgi:hypothetical protein
MSAFDAISQDPLPLDHISDPQADGDPKRAEARVGAATMADNLAQVSNQYKRLMHMTDGGLDLQKGSDESVSSTAAILGEIIRAMLQMSSRMVDSELLLLRGELAQTLLEALQMVSASKYSASLCI